MCDSDNYRSIALSSVIGKVFDKIILLKHADALATSPLQFGFKRFHSTTQCTFALEEIIDHYVSRNSSVYCVLLDASKAFDRVHYVKLFSLLVNRGLCPMLCLLLIAMYSEQHLLVRWNNVFSPSMRCRNGVKQGGVLSPTLFCIYMDELLKRLCDAGIGCHFGSMFAGALCYADDLTLLAPTRNAMQKMILICESFANEFYVKFNPTKSMFLVFGNSTHCQSTGVCLMGSPIRQVQSALHLGVVIGENAFVQNIRHAVGDMYSRTNILMSRFGYCSSQVICKLFRSYCSHFYGCPIWFIDPLSIDQLVIAWRKCCRRVLKLPCRTRSRFIPALMHVPNLSVQLLGRFLNFWKKCTVSENPLVKLISEQLNDFRKSNTPVSFNLKHLLSFCKVSHFSFVSSLPRSFLSPYFSLSDEDVAIVGGIEELSFDLPNLSYSERVLFRNCLAVT